MNLLRDESKEGIWQFSSFLSPLPDQFKLTQGEGGTAEIVFDESLILKREDQNPSGSLKDRGMAYLISWAYARGKKDLVLSSSGNAAISAAEYCRIGGVNLYVFISPAINKEKMSRLQDSGVKFFISPRPVSEAVKFSQKNGFFNLRPSRNEFGLEGYQTIAFELASSQGLIEDIFIPVSSGVVLLGVARGFKKLGFLPKIHLCQSTAVCPIASFFTKDYLPEEKSLAEALVARFTPLKSKVIEVVRKSKGTGWVISNQEIVSSQRILAAKEIETSAEGALAFAAWQKAKNSGWPLGKTVCLLTGKKYSQPAVIKRENGYQ